MRRRRSDLSSRDVSRYRFGVAQILGVAEDHLTIDAVQLNERRAAAHLFVRAAGAKFFAKVLLQDPVPSASPITFPAGDMFLPCSGHWRAASTVLRTERNAATRLPLHLPGVSIPRYLGHSDITRTIVWEHACGTRLDALLKRHRLGGRAATRAEAALEGVGRCLKATHAIDQRGSVAIPLNDGVEALLTASAAAPSLAAQRSVAQAIDTLRAGAIRLGNVVTVPSALTHGDPSLPNVLWDADSMATTVLDFEHTAHRPIAHDLVVVVSNLRVKLLNPSVSATLINNWEDAFWRGYGSIEPSIRRLSELLSVAWIFYWFIPGLDRRLGSRGASYPLALWTYRHFIQPLGVRRVSAL